MFLAIKKIMFIHELNKEGISYKMYRQINRAVKNMEKGIVSDLDWDEFCEMADEI